MFLSTSNSNYNYLMCVQLSPKCPFLQSLGEHASEDEVKNADAANGGQHQGDVVRHIVLSSSSLVNSESIVDLKCLLPPP